MRNTKAHKLVSCWKARENCNEEWIFRHSETIDKIVNEIPLQGVEIHKVGTQLIVLSSSQYVCDDQGFHLGYLEFLVSLYPCFLFGISARVEIQVNPGLDEDTIEAWIEYFVENVESYFSSEA